MADYNSKYTGREIDSSIGKVLNNSDNNILKSYSNLGNESIVNF